MLPTQSGVCEEGVNQKNQSSRHFKFTVARSPLPTGTDWSWQECAKDSGGPLQDKARLQERWRILCWQACRIDPSLSLHTPGPSLQCSTDMASSG